MTYYCGNHFLNNRIVYTPRYPHIEKLSWNASAQFCRNLWNGTGQMIRLRYPNEHRKIHDILGGGALSYWIGASDINREEQWSWMDGCPVKPSIVKWAPGQPDNVYGQQHCLTYSKKYQLDDDTCSRSRLVVCELSPIKTHCGKNISAEICVSS